MKMEYNNKTFQEKMEQLHQASLELLCEIDRVCKKNDIQYFLIGGTLLGAVREKDFIPWDDDVDIGVTRENYDKMKAAFQKDLDKRFRVFDSLDYPEFYDYSIKIVDMRLTVPCKTGNPEYYHGRYCHPAVDVCILDTVGRFHKLRCTMLLMTYALSMGHREYVEHKKFRGIRRIGSYVLPTIGRLIPTAWEDRLYTAISKSGKKYKNLVYFSNIDPAWPMFGRPFERTDFEVLTTGKIRGVDFPIPAAYDKILCIWYGDYMTPPPESERVYLRNWEGLDEKEWEYKRLRFKPDKGEHEVAAEGRTNQPQ